MATPDELSPETIDAIVEAALEVAEPDAAGEPCLSLAYRLLERMIGADALADPERRARADRLIEEAVASRAAAGNGRARRVRRALQARRMTPVALRGRIEGELRRIDPTLGVGGLAATARILGWAVRIDPEGLRIAAERARAAAIEAGADPASLPSLDP